MRLSILYSILGFLLTVGCSNNKPTLSSVDITTKQLINVGAWKVSGVSEDGVDKTAQYVNFTLTFTATSYSTTHGTPVWPTSGTWKFDDATAKSFSRDDGIDVTIENITESSLRLSFKWNQTTLGGKLSSISGKIVFSLTK